MFALAHFSELFCTCTPQKAAYQNSSVGRCHFFPPSVESCISSQSSPHYKALRKCPFYTTLITLEMIIQSKAYNRGPPCPLTALQHVDPLPTDMKSNTNITWDYKSTLVRARGALTWLFALAWEHSNALTKQEKSLRGETFTFASIVSSLDLGSSFMSWPTMVLLLLL